MVFGLCVNSVRYAHSISWNTLAYLFGGTVFAFIGFCVGAAENTAVYVSIDNVVFIIFFTPTGLLYSPASPRYISQLVSILKVNLRVNKFRSPF